MIQSAYFPGFETFDGEIIDPVVCIALSGVGETTFNRILEWCRTELKEGRDNDWTLEVQSHSADYNKFIWLDAQVWANCSEELIGDI